MNTCTKQKQTEAPFCAVDIQNWKLAKNSVKTVTEKSLRYNQKQLGLEVVIGINLYLHIKFVQYSNTGLTIARSVLHPDSYPGK